GEGAAAATGEIPRPQGQGAALPPALPRPDRESGGDGGFPDTKPHRRGDADIPEGTRLYRGRDSRAAGDGGRRRGAPLQDAPQRARHGALPADRARALPEAA